MEERIAEIEKRIMNLNCFDWYNYKDNGEENIFEIIKDKPLDIIEWLLEQLEEKES